MKLPKYVAHANPVRLVRIFGKAEPRHFGWAEMMSDNPGQGQMTYHLRRLRLHGIVERIPQTHC